MRLTVFAATLAFLLWGTPLFAQDSDSDGVDDAFDNCSDDSNFAQDDTDADDCGNLCDADYNNSGVVAGFSDYTEFVGAFGTGDEEKCHNEPIPTCVVGFPDFGQFVAMFLTPPGPSGTTAGTTACP